MLNFKSFLTYGTALAVTAPSMAQKAAPVKQSTPNIIIILMDDMGYGDIGRTGANQYETPNLDRLAAQGMQFTWFYCPQA
ncbi:MAG TPA: sulfatase-like hydrolase/transferase, partial [Bacteroidales bacterium]|nr:sulfatase-like hydrolase/transferase [Bacteroidales bacterium]